MATATLHSPTRTTDTPPTPKDASTRRLFLTELRLLRRDPFSLCFVLGFPIVSMLVIGGVFGTEPDEVFPVNPAHWYVASYFTLVMAATGLIMLPVHIASYRELGVLRRFTASGFPRWSFATAQIGLGLVAIAVSGAALLAVAAPVYGLPAVEDWPGTLAAITLAALGATSLGVLLGMVLPSARAAQALGLTLFFPSFLLGGGGPPTAVMSDALAAVADVLPVSVATTTIRNSWMGIDDATTGLIVLAVGAAVLTAAAVRRSSL